MPRDSAKVRHLLCTEVQTAPWPPKDPAAEELEMLMPSLLQADWINSVKLQRHCFQYLYTFAGGTGWLAGGTICVATRTNNRWPSVLKEHEQIELPREKILTQKT